MRQGVRLSIPEQCHEDWLSMTPQAGGRFCGSCEKTVVDFSGMSDEELLQYFLRAKGPVCGRLTESQLDRGLSGGGSVRSWAGLRWGLLLAGFLVIQRVEGQRVKARRWVRARVELVNVRKIYGPDRLEDRIRRMEPEHGRFLAPQCLSEGPVLMGRMGGIATIMPRRWWWPPDWFR